MSDLIDRQAAIDLVEDLETKRLRGDIGLLYAPTIKGLRALPSADQWIPCSERLPDPYQDVWVTIKGHDVIMVEEGETLQEAAERISKTRWVLIAEWSEDEKCWIDCQFGFPLICQPIAWMKMDDPEPWKGEA